ncbi:60S acidic ribosomal protein P0 [Tupaia chinensis]|uniref:Large ribosomal subunit protein uL10 n=1 Tax=Tupaia chinensis TaxID=246437 RepID=L9L0I8_TUPCH|nr:60S acidic ribosomal protein P0 [Tupaia chinensis]
MMPREDRVTWKSNNFLKIIQLLDDYPKCFIMGADNVGSKQIQLIIQQVIDNGSIYNPEVLDITVEALHSHFLEGIHHVASVCQQIGYPTVASVSHSIINGYKRVLALSVESDYTFPLSEKVKAFLADPSAYVATASMATATTVAPAATKTPAKVET